MLTRPAPAPKPVDPTDDRILQHSIRELPTSQVDGRPVVIHQAGGKYCAEDVLSLRRTKWHGAKHAAEAQIAAETQGLDDGRLVWLETPSGAKVGQ
jgi:phosphatidylserine decarboxylase